jgi:exosortase family protein XrtF
MIGVDGAHPIWIGGPCDGVAIMAIFLIFVSAFPGNQIHKLWYIPLGILLIHFINVLRVAGLTLINFYAPEYLDFNHNYTFTFLVYGFIFILWITWVNKFSKR